MGELRWIDRARVLAPIAACGRGAAADALALKLSSWPADRLAKLSGVSVFAPERAVFVLAQSEDDLPWVDGIQYLGKDPHAPQLLLPTAERPDIHLSLFERAITRVARTPGLIAVLAPPARSIIPLRAALPLSSKKLRDFIEGNS